MSSNLQHPFTSALPASSTHQRFGARKAGALKEGTHQTDQLVRVARTSPARRGGN